MKILLTILFIFPSFLINAQQSPSRMTTEVEYNYLTKGYKVQIESGLDMKKGYKFEDIAKLKESNYDYNFKFLIREDRNEIAGILVIVKSELWGNTYYLCIPHDNPELLSRYFTQINSWDSSITKSYLRVLSGYVSELTYSNYEIKKQPRK